MRIKQIAFPWILAFLSVSPLAAGAGPPTPGSPEATGGGSPDPLAAVIWGKPTNNIALGVLVAPRGYPALPGPGVNYYLKNVGPTNMPFNWIAPPGPARYRVDLRDSKGRTVPQVASNSGSARKYHSLTEVPRYKRHGSGVIGLIRLPTNSVMPFISARLTTVARTNHSAGCVALIECWPPADKSTNLFILPEPGRYTLLTRGQIMQIKGWNLTPMETPPVPLVLEWDGGDRIRCEP